MRRIKKIIIHCSATPKGMPFTIEDVRRWHVKGNGWKDVGYHYVIHLDGSVHAGRDENEVGAHCAGHNYDSIGICYIGGVSADGSKPEDTRTPEQRNSLKRLAADLLKRYPGTTLHGHNEFNPRKACPSFRVNSQFTIHNS